MKFQKERFAVLKRNPLQEVNYGGKWVSILQLRNVGKQLRLQLIGLGLVKTCQIRRQREIEARKAYKKIELIDEQIKNLKAKKANLRALIVRIFNECSPTNEELAQTISDAIMEHKSSKAE